MSYGDKLLHCRDCDTDFVFTAGEQEFYAARSFQNDPTRCSTCRRARKVQHGDSNAPTMRTASVASRAPREMFTATCAECGKTANVPFVPRNDKPVYCSDCYAKVRMAQ